MSMYARAYLALLVGFTGVAAGQGVVIGQATPATVVEALKAELVPQGFQVVRSNEKGALFALDRGVVQQQGTSGLLVHIVLEFTVRFKQKTEGLQVTASEEVVGNPRSRTQFRKPVESLAERNNMQRMLESIRDSLQAHPPKP